MTTKFLAGLIVSVSLVAAPLPVAAQIATPKDSNVAKVVASEDSSGQSGAVAEKKVCKQLPSSSSRLPKRVCLTAKEWKQVEAEVDR